MSRINIEDVLYSDWRYQALSKKLGEDRALGHLCRFWRVAQQFWKQEKKLIPEVAFKAHGFSELLFEYDLAVRTNEGVYAKGSDTHFKWVLQRVSAGLKRKGSKNNGVSKANSNRKRNGTNAEPMPPSPSPSPSLNTKYNTNTNTNTVPESPNDANASSATPEQSSFLPEAKETPSSKPNKKPVDHNQELCRQIWESYRNSYQARYGRDPLRNAKINSQIVQLSKRLGADAVEIVRFYVRSEKDFYRSVFHVLDPCVKDAEALHTQWATGIKGPQDKAFKTATEKKHDWMRNMAAKYVKTPIGGN